jgi:hypothetical protein
MAPIIYNRDGLAAPDESSAVVDPLNINKWPGPWKAVFCYQMYPEVGQTSPATAEEVLEGMDANFGPDGTKLPVPMIEAMINYQKGKTWTLKDRPNLEEHGRMEEESSKDSGKEFSAYNTYKLASCKSHVTEFDNNMRGFTYKS